MSSTVTGGASEEEARASARKNVARAQQVFPRSLDRKEDKIDKRLLRFTSPRDRLRALLKFADELNKPLECFTACRSGCSFCCRMPTIELSQLEAEEICEHTGAAVSLSPPCNHIWEPCPFLKDDRCSIYEHRPFFCRTHVVFMNSPLWCAPDKCNEVDMPTIAFPNLLRAYVELPKGEVRDIREVFPRDPLSACNQSQNGSPLR